MSDRAADRFTRDDARISACSACDRYGMVSTDTGTCACDHQHPTPARGYGCRILACRRIVRRREERAERSRKAAA